MCIRRSCHYFVSTPIRWVAIILSKDLTNKRKKEHSSPNRTMKGSWWIFCQDNEHPSILGLPKRAWNAPHYAKCDLISLTLLETHVLSKNPQGPLNAPGGTGMITLEVSDSRSCHPEGWVPPGKKRAVTPLYPPSSPQWTLTRRTSHLKSLHSNFVTIHGHHFLNDKCPQKVPFILLSELLCLLPSRDPEVEELPVSGSSSLDPRTSPQEGPPI